MGIPFALLYGIVHTHQPFIFIVARPSLNDGRASVLLIRNALYPTLFCGWAYFDETGVIQVVTNNLN
jgi:hypothetical protein